MRRSSCHGKRCDQDTELTRIVRISEVVRGSWVKTAKGWAYARRVKQNRRSVAIQYDSFDGYDPRGPLNYLLLPRETLIETSSSRP